MLLFSSKLSEHYFVLIREISPFCPLFFILKRYNQQNSHSKGANMFQWIVVAVLVYLIYYLINKYERRIEVLQELIELNRSEIKNNQKKIEENKEKISQNAEGVQRNKTTLDLNQELLSRLKD